MNSKEPNFNPKFPSQKQDKPINSEEKEILWNKKREEVNKIIDHLGFGIDEKIRKSVTAFLVHGFTTSQSCEGHISGGEEEKHGYPFPWIEIYAPEPRNWGEAKGEKKQQLEQDWTIENLKQQKKMMDFFTEFYRDRETPFDARLTFDHIGAFGGFRVQSFGAKMMKLLPPEEQFKKLELYRKEMKDFTDFLKSKYFSK